MRAIERVLVDQRLVQTGERLIAPVNTTDIRLVAQHPEHDVGLPATRRSGRMFVHEAPGDRSGTEPAGRVAGEDAADDGRGALIGDELLLLVACVSEWDASVGPASFPGASLNAAGDAVDDGGVLELGEHAEHLQHHAAGR
ncbi:MAG TPA: hypothetical protein VHY18_02565 [Solirubrobacteraceae bacterium]|nr:hypothetical protein [Solirubrobacteraceae bacterium]